MWRRPNSWKPGESISALVRAASSQYHWVAVVVWRPVLSACEISPICALASAHHQVDERALAGAARAEDERRAAGEQRRQARARLGAVALQRELEHVDAHRGVGLRGARAPRRRLGRSRLLRTMRVAIVGLGGGDQRARELRLAEHRLGRDDDEQLVDVGGERLRLPLVLAVEQVGARQDRVDHAFVARRLPADAIADDGVALLAARVAEDARAVVALDQQAPAVPRNDPAFARPRQTFSRGRRRGHRPWRRR